MRSLLVALALVLPITLLTGADKSRQADAALALSLALQPQTPRPWLSPEPFPKGMERYELARRSQKIYTTRGFTLDHIDRIWISDLASKWQQSGGMEGLKGWKSDKFRLLPKPPRSWVGDISIFNGVNNQDNRGIKREYAEGSRFDDVLSNDDGVVFEHRSRQKHEGKWESLVLHKDTAARPKGYVGLKVTCNSCHNAAGTGDYTAGLVPGGDTVLSDPLDWKVWER